MGVTCIGCDRFTFEKIGSEPTKAARLGLGRCALDRRSFVFYSASYVRECGSHQPRDAAATTKFAAWLRKQGTV